MGIGGLLVDTWRVFRLWKAGRLHDTDMATELARAALNSLESFAAGRSLEAPAAYRLAFRELGLAIGLRAVACLAAALDAGAHRSCPELRAAVEVLVAYVPLADETESFWLAPAHQRPRTWQEHLDINAVMLATCLLPDGFLGR